MNSCLFVHSILQDLEFIRRIDDDLYICEYALCNMHLQYVQDMYGVYRICTVLVYSMCCVYTVSLCADILIEI